MDEPDGNVERVLVPPPPAPVVMRATINLPGAPHGTLVTVDPARASPYVKRCIDAGYLVPA